MSRDSAVSGPGKSSTRSVMRQQIPALPYLETNTPAAAFCCGYMNESRMAGTRGESAACGMSHPAAIIFDS